MTVAAVVELLHASALLVFALTSLALDGKSNWLEGAMLWTLRDRLRAGQSDGRDCRLPGTGNLEEDKDERTSTDEMYSLPG